MRLVPPILLASFALALTSCGDAAQSPSAEETAIPVEPDGGIGDGATPLPKEPPAGQSLFEATMPEALRGRWREDDLGRKPKAEDCDQTSSSNRKVGKVLTVLVDGYGLFEDRGQIVEVHDRSEAMIDATFATTSAGKPGRARKDFAYQLDGSLALKADDGDGNPSVTKYLSCPKS